MRNSQIRYEIASVQYLGRKCKHMWILNDNFFFVRFASFGQMMSINCLVAHIPTPKIIMILFTFLTNDQIELKLNKQKKKSCESWGKHFYLSSLILFYI